MTFSTSVRQWAWNIKQDVVAVYFASRDPRTRLHVRLLAVVIAAYALSPIDLIPDFIPILGYLDDLLIVPLGLMIVIRLLPPEILAESRVKARTVLDRPKSIAAAAVIIGIWILCIGLTGLWLAPYVLK